MEEKNEIIPAPKPAASEGQTTEDFRMETNPTPPGITLRYSSDDPANSNILPESIRTVDGKKEITFDVGPAVEKALKNEKSQVIAPGTRFLVEEGGVYKHLPIEIIEAKSKSGNPVTKVFWGSAGQQSEEENAE